MRHLAEKLPRLAAAFSKIGIYSRHDVCPAAAGHQRFSSMMVLAGSCGRVSHLAPDGAPGKIRRSIDKLRGQKRKKMIGKAMEPCWRRLGFNWPVRGGR